MKIKLFKKKCEHLNAETVDQQIITTWRCLDCDEIYETEHLSSEHNPSPPPKGTN